MKIHTNNISSLVFAVEILLCLVFSLVTLNCVAADYKKVDFKVYSTFRNGINVIHLPAGVFFISETISLPSNTILEGEGDDTILRAIGPFKSPRFISNSDYKQDNVNITLRSFKIEFNLPILKGDSPGVVRFENVDSLQIQNVTMAVNSAMYGIDLANNIRHALVEDCIIVNQGQGGGIMVRNRNPNISKASDIITIRNNQLKSITDEPLAVFGWLGVVQNVLIEKNKVEAQGASFGISVFGIDKIGHTGRINNVKVFENIVEGGKIGGITVKGGAQDIEILGNFINGQAADGIFLHTGGNNLPPIQKVVVTKNTINNIGRHGIFATGIDILVDGNTISDCKGSGIYVGNNIMVLNNTITNARPGILVDGFQNRVVRNNTLRNAYGISVLNNNHSGIEDNVIQK